MTRRKTAQPRIESELLAEELDIYGVEAAYKTLRERLAAGDELEVDLRQVKEVDGAGLQLLVALVEEARQCAKPLRLIAPSPAVAEVIELFNMGAYFGEVLVPAAAEANP